MGVVGADAVVVAEGVGRPPAGAGRAERGDGGSITIDAIFAWSSAREEEKPWLGGSVEHVSTEVKLPGS